MLDSPFTHYYVLSKNEFSRLARCAFHWREENCMLKFFIALSGGDNRDRTGNLQLAKLALSQLSYVPGCPDRTKSRKMALLETDFF